jgi:predicted aminopeptidase
MLALAAIAASALLSSCYETKEGFAYLDLIGKARSNAAVLADPSTPEAERLLLERVTSIRGFATAELGLKDTKNYRSIVGLDRDWLASVVQACAPLSFERHLWSYPVVGRLPYKGFFDEADAEKEAAARRAEGLDVIVRKVDAFSTLGWLADPLFSFMSSYSEAELAELVIHEMTHATAFSKAPGDFNEELATFVGREGARRYLMAANASSGEAAAADYLASSADAAAFAAFLRGTRDELAALYSSKLPDAEKRAGKARIIAARAAAYREEVAPAMRTPGYRGFDMGKINNAFIDLYSLYEGEPELYSDYLAKVCAGDLRRFVTETSRLAKDKGDPKEAMRAEIEKAQKLKG